MKCAHSQVTLSTLFPCKKNPRKSLIVNRCPQQPPHLDRCLKSRRSQEMGDVYKSNLMPAFPEVPVFPSVPQVVQILPASTLANAEILEKSTMTLCLRLSLIHKLGIPISKERQNLEGRKGHTLVFLRETGCCAETCTTPDAQRTERERVTHLPVLKSLKWLNPQLHLYLVKRATACPKALRASGKAQLAPTQLKVPHS